MHSTMHTIYAPIFRRTYLREFVGLPEAQVQEILKREAAPQGTVFNEKGEVEAIVPTPQSKLSSGTFFGQIAKAFAS